MRYISIILMLIIFCCFRTSAQKFVPDKKGKRSKQALFPGTEIPPGIIILPNGSMMDETEITNFNWCEYLYWIDQKIGPNSPEYLAALPDSTIWIQTDTCLRQHDEFYLRHPAYRNYPVVGITQQQALDFCNWRTNRVYEYILIREGVIKWETDQTKETHFTIERYLAGRFKNYVPDTNFNYVPRYNLPSISEWEYAISYTDSLECIHFSRSKKEERIKCWTDPFINAGNPPCFTSHGGDVTGPVSSFCIKKRLPKYIYNLRGNVREWVIEKDTCIGGGWNDSKKMIYSQPAAQQTKPSANTGFRCVCVWERISH